MLLQRKSAKILVAAPRFELSMARTSANIKAPFLLIVWFLWLSPIFLIWSNCSEIKFSLIQDQDHSRSARFTSWDFKEKVLYFAYWQNFFRFNLTCLYKDFCETKGIFLYTLVSTLVCMLGAGELRSTWWPAAAGSPAHQDEDHNHHQHWRSHGCQSARTSLRWQGISYYSILIRDNIIFRPSQ
jgi:hypothetical protein